MTKLVAKMYPPKLDAPKALFAVVCETKGAHNDYTVSNIDEFLRGCGVNVVVYKSDQEASVVALMNEVIRRSTTPGNQFFGLIQSAVPENSAVGGSQSNSRAERSVQTF